MTDSRTEPNADLDDFLGVQPEKPWKKWAVRGAIGLVLLILVLLLARCFTGSDQPNYSTREARRGDLTVTVSATGNLKPVNQVDVGSEQSGKITNVFVDVNDRVTKGQKLAELDTRRLIDNVNQNESQVAAAQAGVAQAQAQAALAKATLDRQLQVAQLSGGRVPSKTELDSARATYEQALASVRSTQAQVKVANAQLSTAQTNLDIAQIVSPVDGVVLSRDIEPGQTVAASLNAPVLFTLAEDLTRMEVQVSVDEADVGQVKDGQDATFTVDAFPGRNFPARITRVNVGSNASSSSSSASSSSSSTAASSTSTGTVVAYTAVLSVENSDETLRPGMTATADIVTKQLENVLLVPNAALRFNPNQARGGQAGGITSTLVPGPRRFGNRASRSVSFGAGSSQTVYVLGEDGKPKAMQVVVGDSDGSRTVIASGDLKEGMKVITGQLAAGATAPPDDKDSAGTGERRRQHPDQQQPTAPAQPAPANGNAPAGPAPATTGGETRRVNPAVRQMPAGLPEPPGGKRIRDLTPEERQAYFESLTPAQRDALRKFREERRAARTQAGAPANGGSGDAD